jgi:hypothetical protein
MLTRTSLAIHMAAATIGAAIALCVFYYPPPTTPGEGHNIFVNACGVSTFPASWLAVHLLPDRYFYDYFWLTPPPDLGPQWVPVVVLAVVNSLLWTTLSLVAVYVARRLRGHTATASNQTMERTSDRP